MDDYRRYRGGSGPQPASRGGYREQDDDLARRELFGNRGAPGGGGYAQPPPRGGSNGHSAQGGNYGSQANYGRGRYDQGGYGGNDGDGYGGYGGGYGSGQQQYDQEEEEVNSIKQQISNVKQDTLYSTRNAVRKLQESEEMATGTLTRLGQQGEQLYNVERNMELARVHADHASEKAAELKKLNRSIFVPVFKNPFKSKKRKEQEIQRVQDEIRQRQETEEMLRREEYQTQRHVGGALRRVQDTPYSQMDYQGAPGGRSASDRARYQFEADEEDNRIEDEIDSNLDYMSAATSRLKDLALSMGQEVDRQNKHIERINPKVVGVNERVGITNHKISKIK
ncbi:uncharacterized protein VTP21DRAFT_4328 [Calcarisporiella thermophila]|uniref:uncharacterized protein n=1 Tax=Calcarisporiella thermophila TaxID=911321 RepID=UPI003743F850